MPGRAGAPEPGPRPLYSATSASPDTIDRKHGGGMVVVGQPDGELRAHGVEPNPGGLIVTTSRTHSGRKPSGGHTPGGRIRALVGRTRRVALALLLVSPLPLHPVHAAAQLRTPEEGGRTRSLGQPGPWDFHLGASVGSGLAADAASRFRTVGHVGVYRDLVGLPLSLLGLEGNAWGGAVGNEFDWGVRGQVMSPLFRLGVGVDYSGAANRGNAVFSLVHPVRRGGLFGFGSTLRLDYLPGRDHTATLGFQLPVGRTLPMGRTRPREGAVRLRPPLLDPVPLKDPPPALVEALRHVAEASHWIHRYVVPFIEHPGWTDHAPSPALVRDLEAIPAHAARVGDLYPRGRGYADEVRVYHAELERAFSIAASGRPLPVGAVTPEGLAATRRAREVLLHEVLLPYNRLLGQRKSPDTTLPLAGRARGLFIRWLHTEAPIPEDRVGDVFRVFVRLLEMVERNRQEIRDAWRDSRLVWLPLQYALRPEDHATQAQLDALVELAVERPFTDGNRISYIINEQFDYQLGRMIHAAEDYHVLWIHDFPGINQDGTPDAVAYSQVLDSYLAALIARVRDYDRTGKLPVYMIFIDEWFYAARNGRLWMDFLEDPMNHQVKLPGGYEAWEESIGRGQEELRSAVATSALLQSEAAQYGADWLRDRVKVHVNITNRSDPSFWIRGIIPIAGTPDGVMRDHRKVAFYDVTEEDPYRGRAMYTGMGVGEQYTSLNWEDRAVMLQGPAALGLKEAARDLLLDQGIPPTDIPWHLQPRQSDGPLPPPPADHVEWAGDARVLEIHNQTGYRPKSVNVAKAVLYTLLGPGGVIKAPDSLWNSGFWAGMLLGSSLRGVRVLVIAPADANAPSRGFGQLARARELFVRLVVAQQILAAEIEAAGGLLRTGIYATETPVTDVGAKLAAFMDAYEREPWFPELFPLDPSILPMLRSILAGLPPVSGSDEATGPGPATESRPGGPGNDLPKLHLKGNFLASAEAWNGLLSRPELGSYFRVWMENRVAQLQDRELARRFPGATSERMLEAAMPTLTAWEETLTPEERDQLVFYLMVGSTNQNYRSMVMDGEVSVLLSGWTSIVGIVDFISLAGQSVWVDDLGELQALSGTLPEYRGWRRWLGQRVRLGL